MTIEDLLAVIHRDGGHHTVNAGMERSIADAAVAIHDKDKRIAFLEEQLRRIHRVGHNDDCLFCGFKDRQVMESNVIEGTAAMSAEEVAEKNVPVKPTPPPGRVLREGRDPRVKKG